MRDHFMRDWLGVLDGHGFWRDGLDQAKIIRRAMLEVCERYRSVHCNGQQKHCEYLWVIADVRYGSRFEITIAECTDRITVIYHTPEPDYSGAVDGPPCKSKQITVIQSSNGKVEPRFALIPRLLLEPKCVPEFPDLKSFMLSAMQPPSRTFSGPDLIQKPPIFQLIDEYSRDAYWAPKAVLTLREGDTDIAALDGFCDLLGAKTKARQQLYYLVNCSPDGSYWKTYLDPAPVIRRGFQYLCERLRDNPRPCDCFWVSARTTSPGRPCELTITETADRITVLFHSPIPDLDSIHGQCVPSSTMSVVYKSGEELCVRAVEVPQW
jgi:hypothetical protein